MIEILGKNLSKNISHTQYGDTDKLFLKNPNFKISSMDLN